MRTPAALGSIIAACAVLAGRGPLPAQGAVPDPLGQVRAMVDSALAKLNLSPAELGFAKKKPDSFSLDRVLRGLAAPLTLPRQISEFRLGAKAATKAGSAGSLARLALSMAELPLLAARTDGLEESKTTQELLRLLFPGLSFSLPKELGQRGNLGEAVFRMLEASLIFRTGFEKGFAGKLTGKRRDKALATLPALWLERGALREIVGVEAPSISASLHDARWLDWTSLAGTIQAGMKSLDLAVSALERVKMNELPAKIAAPMIEGDVRFYMNTPMGPIVIGGPGRTRYAGDYFLLVDLGGDDSYPGRVAAASMAYGRPFSCAIDLSGDDDYRSKLPLNQGAALLGAAILIDLGKGNDCYEAGDLAQGAALMGFAMLVDDGGSDRYSAGALVQGAAALGFGVLSDRDGNDIYNAAIRAQGFGGVRGYGLLLDASGDDLYRAGSVYRHEPLYKDRFSSFAQGHGRGEREYGTSGGIGFLWDGGGNDQYIADIAAQGSATYMALGVLVDEAGNDSYVCTQDGQGAATHRALAVLWDLSGEDLYSLSKGLGQGGANDLSVAFLLEGAGNDIYTGGPLSQGSAAANAIGMLIDGAGDDSYLGIGPVALFQGYAEKKRFFGSIGLLLDVQGRDFFSHRSRAGETEFWTQGTHGLVWDKGDASEKTVNATWSVPKVLPDPSETVLTQLFAEASLWQVGNNIQVVERARATLVAMGPSASRWIIENKLATTKPLERRALKALVPSFGSTMFVPLRAALSHKEAAGRRNALDLLVRLGDIFSATMMKSKLENDPDPSVRRMAALCLAALRVEDAFAGIAKLAASTASVEDRRTAARALQDIPGKKAVHKLADLLQDESFTVRDPAREALIHRRKDAVDIGLQELEQASGAALEEWLRIFRVWRVKEAREILENKHQVAKDPDVARLATLALAALDEAASREAGDDVRNKKKN